jgi:hypothetical protein
MGKATPNQNLCVHFVPLMQVLVARIQGPDSPFAAYVANLPVGVSGVPMFYPREALEAIEYPPVVEQVRAGHEYVCFCIHASMYLGVGHLVMCSWMHRLAKASAGMLEGPPMGEQVGCMYFWLVCGICGKLCALLRRCAGGSFR